MELPLSVSQKPSIRINYSNQSSETYLLNGQTPGSEFYKDVADIPYAISSIELLDPNGNVKHTWYPGTATNYNYNSLSVVNLYTVPANPTSCNKSNCSKSRVQRNSTFKPDFTFTHSDGAFNGQFDIPTGATALFFEYSIDGTNISGHPEFLEVYDEDGNVLPKEKFTLLLQWKISPVR